jgi:hypothetical protein
MNRRSTDRVIAKLAHPISTECRFSILGTGADACCKGAGAEHVAPGSCWRRGASLFLATSCDTQNKEKSYSVSSGEKINWQGLAAHDVERARQEFHVDGSGVKVCVLSDSLKHLDEAKDIAPQDVAVLLDENGHRQDGKKDGRYLGDGEGTAMLEIVHSIAPGAELMFATKGNSAGTMAKNISALGNLRNKDRCHIIVDDAEFYFQSPFQDDVISKAVNEVTAKGILYITSAGNRGNTRAGTWRRGKAILGLVESSRISGEGQFASCTCSPTSKTASTMMFWVSAEETAARFTSCCSGTIAF